MKQLVILIGVILFVANLMLGMIISSYDAFNLFVSSLVIAFTTALLFYLNIVRLKDGFKIPLYVLFSVLGCIEFILSVFSPKTFEDNWFLLVIILSLTIECVILLITHKISIKVS